MMPIRLLLIAVLVSCFINDLSGQTKTLPEQVKATLGIWTCERVAWISDTIDLSKDFKIEVKVQLHHDTLRIMQRMPISNRRDIVSDADTVWSLYLVMPIRDIYVRDDGWLAVDKSFYQKPMRRSKHDRSVLASDTTTDIDAMTKICWLTVNGGVLLYRTIYARTGYHRNEEITLDSWASQHVLKSVSWREE